MTDGAGPLPKTAYCLKCKTQRAVKDATVVVKTGKRGGTRMMMAKCANCGTKVARILSRSSS